MYSDDLYKKLKELNELIEKIKLPRQFDFTPIETQSTCLFDQFMKNLTDWQKTQPQVLMLYCPCPRCRTICVMTPTVGSGTFIC